MEENKINAEELLKGLNPYMASKEVEEWKAKAMSNGLDHTIADIIYSAYKQGVAAFLGKYVSADEKSSDYERKYTELAIKVCEKLI
jgi:hypothetical protein